MNQYSIARTIAGTLITSQEKELTTERIRECVAQACSLPPANELTPEQRDKLIRELETTYQTVIGEERVLVGDSEGWEAWLPERKGLTDWRYWKRYEELLVKEGAMNQEVRRKLDASTDRVLGHLGDPRRLGSWDRRGLVVGLVQSGKTAHYVGLVNKAVDAGYKVIVVLTGFTESLRVQTQIRAEEGFLGYYLVPGTKHGEQDLRWTGVGEIAPGLKPNSVTSRSNDFKTAVARNFAIQVDGKEILFVVKKNVTVLKNLLSWVTTCGNATDSSGRPFVKDVPLLVIDDESDVGSIDTKKGSIVDDDPDPDHEPSRINEKIRKLLSLFDKSSYVGYTATPFANVLIHDGGRTGALGEDLFPRSFIVSLPTPSDHVGPTMIFGDPGAETPEEGLPIVRHIPDHESEGEEAWIPPSHKKHYRPLSEGRSEVPSSLRTAILSFVLVCCARRLRGDSNEHNSMLVHVTRFNDVQEIVCDQVEAELKGVVDRIRAKTAGGDLLRELRALWETDFLETTREICKRSEPIFQNPGHAWNQIEGQLLATAASIQVRTINGLAGEVLDYEAHKEGLNVIAIGGDKLSRGLTLSGLSVSYFLRCSRMYDTLMQMGRWFGYRPGYLDLCRLYTSEELCDWFGHIATATEELRHEFDVMANSGATPKDFGLRVRAHPQLMVTSQVKMRHGETRQVTFQGDVIETINFRRDDATVSKNWRAANCLIDAIKAGAGVPEHEVRPNCSQWSQVPADKVVAFLDEYQEHEGAIKARTRLLRAYISEETRRGRLQEWTVFVSAGEASAFPGPPLAGQRYPLVERSWYLGRGKFSEEEQESRKNELMESNHYRIRRLVNPPDEFVDLDDASRSAALAETVADYKRDPGRRRAEPTTPAGRFIRQHRDAGRGLLILYPLDSGEDKAESQKLPIMAFAISFPAVPGFLASNVTYTVNNIYQQMEMDD